MKKTIVALSSALLLSACYGGGAMGYGDYGPVAYDGYYDDFYGPVYDGYWGDDGGFWYRGGANDRHFHRGDPAHFAHAMPAGGGQFHAMHGSFTPAHGMAAPHFGGMHGGGGHH